MDLKETCKRCYDAIFNNGPVEVKGKQYMVQKTKEGGLRYVDMKVGRESYRVIEQDPMQVSPWAEKSRQGYKIAWVRKGRANYAQVVDGVFTEVSTEWSGRRVVFDSGCFRAGGRLFFIGKRHAGKEVLVSLDATRVSCSDRLGGEIPVLREVGKSGAKRARKPSRRKIVKTPRSHLLEAKFPFVVDHAFLIAQVDKVTGKQRMIMKKVDPDTGKVVIKDAITCIHTAVTKIPAGKLIEKIGSESFERDLLYIRSSERLKTVSLTPEERFFAFKSWVAGIAEAGMDAFKIQSATETEGKLVYPIARRLMAFAAKINPTLLEVFLEKVVRECRYEGILHNASLLANLTPFVKFAVEKRNTLFLETILNLDLPITIFLDLILGVERDEWVFPKVAGKNVAFMQALREHTESKRADSTVLQQIQHISELGGSPEITEFITSLNILPHYGDKLKLQKRRLHLLRRTLETKIYLTKDGDVPSDDKEIFWWGENDQFWGDPVVISSVPHLFSLHFTGAIQQGINPESAFRRIDMEEVLSVTSVLILRVEVTQSNQTDKFRFKLSAPYFEGQIQVKLELPGITPTYIEFPVIHEQNYTSRIDYLLNGISGLGTGTANYLRDEFRKTHLQIDPLPLSVIEQGIKLLSVLAAWLEEESQTLEVQRAAGLHWHRIKGQVRFIMQSWFFGQLQEKLRTHFVNKDCNWTHPAIWIRDIPLEYKVLTTQSHLPKSKHAVDLPKLWILNRRTKESMQVRLGFILIYDYRQDAAKEITQSPVYHCIKFMIKENRMIICLVMLGNRNLD